MHAAVPFGVWIAAQPLDSDFSHACHDSHAEHDINGIGDFKADFGERRIGWPHNIGNNKHRPTPHRVF